MWRVWSLYHVTKRNNKESGHTATKLLRRFGDYVHADGLTEDTWTMFIETGVWLKKWDEHFCTEGEDVGQKKGSRRNQFLGLMTNRERPV